MDDSYDSDAFQKLCDEADAKRANARKSKDGATAENHNSGPEPLHSWESPDWSILDDRRGELPDFPLDCLGGSLRAWVERAAAGAGVTVAHVAVPALVIASSLV